MLQDIVSIRGAFVKMYSTCDALYEQMPQFMFGFDHSFIHSFTSLFIHF